MSTIGGKMSTVDGKMSTEGSKIGAGRAGFSEKAEKLLG
jgi:hypothetical protein